MADDLDQCRFVLAHGTHAGAEIAPARVQKFAHDFECVIVAVDPERWENATPRGSVVGQVMIEPLKNDPSVDFIAMLHVVPQYREQGIGEQLLREATLRAIRRSRRCVTLMCDIDNTEAWKWYLRRGFHPYADVRTYSAPIICDGYEFDVTLRDRAMMRAFDVDTNLMQQINRGTASS